MFKEEYGYYITITKDISALISKYADGVYQSGPEKLPQAVNRNNSHCVLVSQVDGFNQFKYMYAFCEY